MKAPRLRITPTDELPGFAFLGFLRRAESRRRPAELTLIVAVDATADELALLHPDVAAAVAEEIARHPSG